MQKDKIDRYLSGEMLIGDDYTERDIRSWFAEEEEAYADLGSKEMASYRYAYHELNKFHGFSRLEEKTYGNVLGLGSAYGHELFPIADKIKKLKISDPSEAFRGKCVLPVSDVSYIKPGVLGDIDSPDAQFDLITCFGVLHHVPNVSHVMKECGRVLERGGAMLLREPIVSMGDWRKNRKGLTARERGIPLGLLRRFAEQASLDIDYEGLCFFSPLLALAKKMKCAQFSTRSYVLMDSYLSKVFARAPVYHRERFRDKIAPSNVFMILRRKP